jgi:hypothetical protein
MISGRADVSRARPRVLRGGKVELHLPVGDLLVFQLLIRMKFIRRSYSVSTKQARDATAKKNLRSESGEMTRGRRVANRCECSLPKTSITKATARTMGNRAMGEGVYGLLVPSSDPDGCASGRVRVTGT